MDSMTHRQRVITALNHREPDRVPCDFGGTRASTIVPRAYEHLKRYLAINSETRYMDRTLDRVVPDESIIERFDADALMLRVESPLRRSEGLDLPCLWEDEWGVVWQVRKDSAYHVAKPPFSRHSSIQELRQHAWPDPKDLPLESFAARTRAIRERSDRAIVLELPARVFSLGQRLCGFQDWLMNLVGNPGFATGLLSTAVEIEIEMVKAILGTVDDNVDVVLCPDDLGMQDRPIISPDLYRKTIKPHHKRLFEAIKSWTDARLMLHSDGAIAPLIGDLIEVGIDVLNPVQVSASGLNDTVQLKETYGSHLSFWGAVDTHRVLPQGTVADVRSEVKRRIDDLAVDGGYVLASVHNVQSDVPPENLCAMFEAAREYGAYG